MRYILSCVAGIAVSLALFLMMTYLIDKHEIPPEPPPPVFPEFAAYEKPDPVIQEAEEFKPPPIDLPPTSPRQIFTIEPLVVVNLPTPLTTIQMTSSDIPAANPQPPELGDITPPDMTVLVGSRVEYPAVAERRNLEGFVLVENTVDKYGKVIDVRVIESSHYVFEKAAKEAVLKWKYSQSALNKRVDKKRIAFNLD